MRKARTKFSAVVVARDEAAQIADCLTPLLRVADEVLLADSGSEDATVAIARQLGARVIHLPWQGYAQTKNQANEQATHDWILSIDADEVLSGQLEQTLLEWQPQAHTVYALDRITNYCGRWVKHSGWYPDWKPRLFNRKAIHWKGAHVHERLYLPKGYKIVRLSGKLYHYSYRDEQEHLSRIEHYARLSALQMLEDGRKASVWKLLLSPPARFLRTLILKGGILDGALGLKLSWRDAFLVWRKYQLLQELQTEKQKRKT